MEDKLRRSKPKKKLSTAEEQYLKATSLKKSSNDLIQDLEEVSGPWVDQLFAKASSQVRKVYSYSAFQEQKAQIKVCPAHVQ